jgi:hypothetical protein
MKSSYLRGQRLFKRAIKKRKEKEKQPLSLDPP